MAQPPPGPILTEEGEVAAKKRLRRAILLIVVIFGGYGIFSMASQDRPDWIKLGPQAFPAELKALAFADGELAKGRDYVFGIKRTGRERSLPPRRMTLTVTETTRATYRCVKRTRCPWIRIAPLRCQLDKAAPGPCGFELFEFGRTGLEVLPRRRCRLTRPGIRDLNVVCPKELRLGARIAKDN